MAVRIRYVIKSEVKPVITVFLSYSTKDHFFAELAGIKLAEAGIKLWRDQGQLVAGTDWRQGIERGISDSLAVLVALSNNSAESSYVTYEWAYALGKGKSIIPLKLTECSVHRKLETIQYLDFSIPGALPWASLIERISEIETDNDQSTTDADAESAVPGTDADDSYVKAILAYLNQRGYQMASFERLRRRIDENLTDEQLREIIDKNNTIFRHATLKGGKEGLAKLVP
jgi:hypothetical protein